MEVVKRKDGSIIGYKEKIYLRNGKTITKTFKRITDAKQWKRRNEFEKESRAASGLNLNDNITYAEFYNHWIEQKKIQLAKRTIDAYKTTSEKWLLGRYGKFKLKEFNSVHGYAFKSELSKSKASIKRINFILRVLKHQFNDAVKWEYLLRSPFKNLDFFKDVERPVSYWTPSEVSRFLIANQNDHYYPLYLVALNTGMRLGELLGLLWDKVDFERRRIIVSRTRDRYGLKETTKTGKVREVPMNQSSYEILMRLKNSSNLSDLNYVFQNEIGDSVSLMHLNDRFFKKSIELAGVRKIRFHDLRSTYASNFVMNGGNLFTLSKILGHSSVVMTEKRYAHLSNEYIGRSADVVNFNSDSPRIALALVSEV